MPLAKIREPVNIYVMLTAIETPFSPDNLRIQPASFSPDEVIEPFRAILRSLDYQPMLEALGIGNFHVFRKKKALKELQALSISLWKLALQRSFPNDFELFYTTYMETALPVKAASKEAELFKARINTYNDLLAPKKENDFSPVAKYLADIFTDNEDASKRFTLKLSLLLRNVYTVIFDNLV